MPTKQETIDNIVPTSNYLGSFVRKMVSEISEGRNVPTTYRKGDVFRVQGGNYKLRPAVCIKVTKNYLVVIPLTSTENEHCMAESKSRFFKEGCFCNSYIILPVDVAKDSFMGVYDSPKVLNNAIKELREFIKKNI